MNTARIRTYRRIAIPSLVAMLSLVSGCSGNAVNLEDVSYSGEPIQDFVKAIEVGDVSTVDQLASSDPTLLELQDEVGQTAMHYAALGNQPGVIRVLHEKGLDINVRDLEGRTPLTVLEDSGFRFEEARDMIIKLGGEN